MSKKCKACGEFKDESEFYKASSNKDGLNSKCKACISLEKKAEYAADPDKFKKNVEESKQRNYTKVIERKRNYWQKTREKQIQQKREKRHGEDYRPKQRLTWKEKRQRMKDRHPDFNKRQKVYRQQRRARRKSAVGSFSPKEWQRLCDEFGNKCLACGEQKLLTIDHVVPLVRGGTNYLSNIQPLCVSCNSRKSRKIIDYRPYIPEWVELRLF